MLLLLLSSMWIIWCSSLHLLALHIIKTLPCIIIIWLLILQGLSAGLLRQATYTTARLGTFKWVLTHKHHELNRTIVMLIISHLKNHLGVFENRFHTNLCSSSSYLPPLPSRYMLLIIVINIQQCIRILYWTEFICLG